MRSLLTFVALVVCAPVLSASVTISTPAPGQSSSSPTHIVADASSSKSITAVAIYLDGVKIYNLQNQEHIETYLWTTLGTHTVTVKAWDSGGAVSSKTLSIDTTGNKSLPNVEDLSGWQWCTQKLNGSVCAAGRGIADSWIAQHQTSPSLDGSSAEFYLGGSTGYSNALWWKSLGGGNKVSHFTYDVYVKVDDPSKPQSLEFDMNQSFGGHRWIFGTQCDFKDTKHWDVWDGTSGLWKTTPLPCTQFKTGWNHLTWRFQRVGNQVRYYSVTLNGVTTVLNIYWGYQASYPNNDINVAFQMDGDYNQDPYHVWLDKLTISGY